MTVDQGTKHEFLDERVGPGGMTALLILAFLIIALASVYGISITPGGIIDMMD